MPLLDHWEASLSGMWGGNQTVVSHVLTSSALSFLELAPEV